MCHLSEDARMPRDFRHFIALWLVTLLGQGELDLARSEWWERQAWSSTHSLLMVYE